ncbi:MAG TPA: hypothetical protein VEX86_27295 [Longimicrobium sp.]|nr:hypothetical protein [Longimicrobium sp.]
MLIPRYWSRAESQAVTPDGKPVRFHVWRGSRSSPAEAQSLADEAVSRIADRISRGGGFPERYAYGDRPLREEVVREIPGAGDAPNVAITRNSYGALVLNAASAFFIDVDVAGLEAGPQAHQPAPSTSSGPSTPGGSLWGLVDSLPLPGGLRSIVDQFRPASGSTPAPSAPSTSSTPASRDGTSASVDRLRRFVAARPEWRVRVYRTFAGLRYLVVHAPFSPNDPDVQAAMAAVGADPQYIRLCQVQKSFRARLTPKPWRIGVENPPVTFPYEGPGEESEMRGWAARYDAASARRATCHFVEEIGSGSEHPDVAAVRALHDEHTRATSGLPLA